MLVERMHPSRLAAYRGAPFDAAIAIDVLRASTTALVLLDRVAEVAVVARLADLSALPPHPWLIVSELAGASASGPSIDNSPVEAGRVALEGRTPCLITTNGTRTLCAASAHAARVWMAGFVNLRATARAIAALAPARVLVLPAGSFTSGEAHLEDELCADALIAELAGAPFDGDALAEQARADPRVQRRLAREVSLGADLDIALSTDRFLRVAEFSATGDNAGWLRRDR